MDLAVMDSAMPYGKIDFNLSTSNKRLFYYSFNIYILNTIKQI